MFLASSEAMDQNNRWSVVAYLRVLQQINRTSLNELNQTEKKYIK